MNFRAYHNEALMHYPQLPQSFWSCDRTMEMVSLKSVILPLGMITIAALLPQDWELRFWQQRKGCD